MERSGWGLAQPSRHKWREPRPRGVGGGVKRQVVSWLEESLATLGHALGGGIREREGEVKDDI